MPSLSVQLDAGDLARLNRRLSKLLHGSLNLEPVWQQAAEYMKQSTKNRILRTKTAPDGERWAALSDVTIEMKGHDAPLFQSGEMAGSVDILEVSNDGFMINTDAPYASYMHNGVQQVKGAFRSKRPAPQIPARPFMGFSDENVRRISKMVRDYLANGGD
jgi:phage virion morphogenesis protein